MLSSGLWLSEDPEVSIVRVEVSSKMPAHFYQTARGHETQDLSWEAMPWKPQISVSDLLKLVKFCQLSRSLFRKLGENPLLAVRYWGHKCLLSWRYHYKGQLYMCMSPVSIRSRDSVVSLVTRLWTGRSGVRIPAGREIFLFCKRSQTGSGAYPVS